MDLGGPGLNYGALNIYHQGGNTYRVIRGGNGYLGNKPCALWLEYSGYKDFTIDISGVELRTGLDEKTGKSVIRYTHHPAVPDPDNPGDFIHRIKEEVTTGQRGLFVWLAQHSAIGMFSMAYTGGIRTRAR